MEKQKWGEKVKKTVEKRDRNAHFWLFGVVVLGFFWGCLHRVYFGGKKGEKGWGGEIPL